MCDSLSLSLIPVRASVQGAAGEAAGVSEESEGEEEDTPGTSVRHPFIKTSTEHLYIYIYIHPLPFPSMCRQQDTLTLSELVELERDCELVGQIK